VAVPVIMPKQGQTVESCVITKWHKNKGDTVKIGDILFSYETDKAAFDEEAKAEGILLEVYYDVGDDVPVLSTVCIIGQEGEDISDIVSQVEEEPETGIQDVTANKIEKMEMTQETDTVKAASPVRSDEIKISPRARNLADKAGVDYRFAIPTGPQGRIIERDIRLLMDTGPVVTPSAKAEYQKLDNRETALGTGIGGRITTSDVEDMSSPGMRSEPVEQDIQAEFMETDYEEIKLSNIRKVIAQTMQESLANSAQLTIHTSLDATEILEFRRKIKEQGAHLGLENITITDIILYAVSRTLLNHKALNAHILDDSMLLFNHVHLGVAVDTERGLMVPTIYSADTKSLSEISREAKELIEACRKGSINPDYLKGGTFTVTNLGTLGVESFTPILNPPQTGILGVNTIVQRVRQIDGQLTAYPAMGLSLTFDHRAVDGAPAARFLQELKTSLENFSIFLSK